MRGVSSPSTMAILPPASIRFSLRSTVHCTWTSVAWSDRTLSPPLHGTWRRCPTGLTRLLCRNCILTGPLPNRDLIKACIAQALAHPAGATARGGHLASSPRKRREEARPAPNADLALLVRGSV